MSRRFEEIRRWTGVSLLGIGHGLGDFNAGLLLASLGSRSGADLVILYLIYNVLAFAGQPLAGIVCDRFGKNIGWFEFGGVLSAISLVIANSHPEVAVVCSGIASAFYHSAGGAAAWDLGRKRVLGAGLFAAPGVIGLAIGLSFGGQLELNTEIIMAGALAFVLTLIYLCTRGLPSDPGRDRTGPILNVGLIGSLFGWLIILAIAARSFAWSLGQQTIFPPEDAVRLAFAAAIGKSFASLAADRFGAAKITAISLIAAVVLLAIGGTKAVFFFPAVTALQAGTGPMMALIFRAWPMHPAFGSGLAQGLAVAAGGAPLLVVSRLGPGYMAAAVGSLLMALAAVFLAMRVRAKRTY